MNENHTSNNDINDVTKNPGVSYEPEDMNVRSLTFFGVGLLAAIIVAMVFIAGLVWSLERRTNVVQTDQPAAAQPMPPEPRIMPNPIDQMPAEDQLKALQSQEEFILDSYDWVNREEGVVRIPITRAMEIMVEQHQ